MHWQCIAKFFHWPEFPGHLSKKIGYTFYNFIRPFHGQHVAGGGDFDEGGGGLEGLPVAPGFLSEGVGLGAADGQGRLGNLGDFVPDMQGKA